MDSIQHPLQLSFDSPQLCECGCGQPAPPARRTNKRDHHIKGQPLRFIDGHQGRTSQTRGYLIFRRKEPQPPKQRKPNIPKIRRARPSAEERFWAKVDKSGGPDACWPWVGAHYKNAYGKFCASHTTTHLAHRVAWELTNGPIPTGLLIRHKVCANKSCCNPVHMLLGTHLDNAADAMADGVVRRGERVWKAKLTQVQADTIRSKYATGQFTLKQIASEYGVSFQTVSAIVLNHRYIHR